MVRTGQAGSNPVYGVVGMLLLPFVWEGAARTPLLDGVVPPVSAIFRALFLDGDFDLFASALRFTAGSAIRGYAIGIAIGVTLAVAALLLTRLRPGLVHFGALVNATPVIALGPVLLATVERNNLPVAVSAFFVFFSVFIAMLSGFRDAGQHHHDVLSVLGVARRERFLYLELPASLPRLAAGMKVAAPAAVVGAIFGEWFGLADGLGPLLISSMQSYSVAALWAATLLAGSMGGLLYLLLSIAERWLTEHFR